MSKREMPFTMTVITTETSGMMASTNADATTIVTTRSVALRAPSTIRDAT